MNKESEKDLENTVTDITAIPADSSNSDTEKTVLAENQKSEIKKENDDLNAQISKLKNDYLYLKAEFENYKRNAIKERSELLKYGAERLIVELLGVFDNFERAISVKPTPETFNTYVKGVEMTAGQIKGLFQNFGISEIPCEKKPFDPSIHEALSSEESDAVPPGHILRVYKKAFKLHDRLVRPAQVVVAKEKAK